MKIALGQIDMVLEDKHSNFVTVEEFVRQAAENQSDLIIFPEMTCTGFTMKSDVFAEKNDETLLFMKKLSHRYHIKICFGQPVYRKGHAYNNLMIVDGEKELLSYDKIHLIGEENDHYEKGNSISFCCMSQMRFAALICYDLRFPEIFQYASLYSDVIIVIASWPEIRDDHWLTLLKARAIENQCYIIGVNRIGKDQQYSYLGHSVVYNSYGEMISSLSEEEENIYVDIHENDTKNVLKGFDTKKDRRNVLYLDLYNKM